MAKKTKFGIKTRVFLSFGFFIIIFTNIFALLMSIFVEKSFIGNLKDNINIEYQKIQKIIDESETSLIQISREEEKEIVDKGLFFYLGYNDVSVIKNYNIGFYLYGENIIFRGDYKGYNILIGKNIRDLNSFKKNLLETTVLLNIFGLFITFTISYFVTNRVLRPLIKLSKYLSDYNVDEDKIFIVNRYGSSEIGLITESLNKFIGKMKESFVSQKYFIQDASHELKTPLMQITTNIELMEDTITDKKNLERLENIKISIENINQILSDLGFLVRGDEKTVIKEKIDMYEFLQVFTKNFEEEAKKKNIKIDIIEEEKFVLENSDYYLNRLFGNLISNSITYNDGNNTIKIKIKDKQVIIEDEGIGISEDDLKRIFNRFYRNKNSDVYNDRGSGLGMTIVKNIIDSFAWNIKIESEEGKYTKITLNF